MNIRKDVRLSDYTSIKLGGAVEYFIEAESVDELIEALKFSKSKSLPLIVLGGGSNILFPDEKLNAVILKINLKGISFTGKEVKVAAGESWDEFVKLSVSKGLQGIECLSGIPGYTGATPIQNVGAYGQEVSDVVTQVECINTKTLETESFTNEQCKFAYRTSRFKNEDRGKYIVTSVEFKLSDTAEPNISYKDIANTISEHSDFPSLSREEKLITIRNEVIRIRKAKSMVIDVEDSDSVSCGSFFMNPVLPEDDFEKFMSLCESKQLTPPYYITDSSYKIPAAWLIENSGFSKGYTENGAGISNSHTLALVNRGCTQTDILNLSEKIKDSVKENFGITLSEEVICVK